MARLGGHFLGGVAEGQRATRALQQQDRALDLDQFRAGLEERRVGVAENAAKRKIVEDSLKFNEEAIGNTLKDTKLQFQKFEDNNATLTEVGKYAAVMVEQVKMQQATIDADRKALGLPPGPNRVEEFKANMRAIVRSSQERTRAAGAGGGLAGTAKATSLAGELKTEPTQGQRERGAGVAAIPKIDTFIEGEEVVAVTIDPDTGARTEIARGPRHAESFFRDFIAPIAKKIQDGEKVDDNEQSLLDLWQRTTLLEQIMRGLVPGGGSPSQSQGAGDDNALLSAAREALAQGAPRPDVEQRLRDNGVDPGLL